MCGIIGFYGRQCLSLDTQYLSLLKHRGPDDAKVIHGENFSFGHSRLSILGLNDGDQPIQDSIGNVLVYNGEIYNCHELQREFLQTNFRSDARILFELLKSQGHRILPRLRGMFAFAFFDRHSKRVLLARDPFGMKPLFYRFKDSVLFFSSELKAMQPLEIDWNNFEEFLYFSNPLPGQTLYRDIHELKPGEYLTCDGHRLDHARYFRLWKIIEHPFESTTTFSEAMENTLKSHILSDVPVGLLLSSGVDSSSLALAASKANVNLSTFTMAYADPEFDESLQARKLAEHLKLEYLLIPFGSDNLREELEEALAKMDQPFGDPSFLPTYQLSRAVSKITKVVLGGDGGDELFFGYPTFQAEAYHQKLPTFLRGLFYRLAGSLGRTSTSRVDLREKMLRFSWGQNLETLERHSRFMCSGMPSFYSQNFYESIDSKMKALLKEDGLNQLGPWSETFFYYFRLYLGNLILVKTDRASMANGLEVRCPFLDIDFIQSAFAYPDSGFPVLQAPKQKLRSYLKESIPSHLLNFQKKGFSTPLQKVLPVLENIVCDHHKLHLPSLEHLRATAPYWLYNILVFLYHHPEEQALETLNRAVHKHSYLESAI